jgi:Flp pilus assembly protein TadB
MTVPPVLAGAAVVGGLLLLVREFTRRAPPPGVPPAWWRQPARALAPSWRWLLAVTVAGLAVLLVTGWPVAGVIAAAAAVFVPKLAIGKGQRQQIAVLHGLDQWTRRVAGLLSAGQTVESALVAASASAPAAIAGPAATLARRLAARSGTEAALRAFAEQLADPAADRVAAALIIATSARGGRVGGVLAALADLMARDAASRHQILAERAQHRTTLWCVIAFILGYAAILFADRSYSAPFGTITGQAVLATVALVEAAALAWVHRLSATPAPGRFLLKSDRDDGPAAAATDGGPR